MTVAEISHQRETGYPEKEKKNDWLPKGSHGKLNETIMAKLQIRGKDLRKMGYPKASVVSVAIGVMEQYYKRHSLEEALSVLKDIMLTPADYLDDPVLGKGGSWPSSPRNRRYGVFAQPGRGGLFDLWRTPDRGKGRSIRCTLPLNCLWRWPAP